MRTLSVLYHSPCMDGFGAACAVKESLNLGYWRNVHYIPSSYQWLNGMAAEGTISRIPHMTTTLLLVDICPDEAALDFLISQGFYLVILDHHNGVRETLSKGKYNEGDNVVKYILADNYSGASLVKAIGDNINVILDNVKTPSNDYFEITDNHGPIQSNFDVGGLIDRERVEKSYLYRLLETRDIWIKDDPDFKLKADILATYVRENDVYKGEIVHNLEEVYPLDKINKILEEGLVVFNKKWGDAVKLVAASYQHTATVKSGHKVTYVVGYCERELGSLFGEVVNTMIDGNTIAVAVMKPEEGEVTAGLSLRSSGEIPCVQIAKSLGGGGHDHASGASVPAHYTLDDVVRDIEKALLEAVKPN